MIFFDITTLAGWRGPPTGIVRVQQKFAEHMRRRVPDVTFTIFDPRTRAWRAIRSMWLDILLSRGASVEMPMPADAGATGASLWMKRPRKKTLMELERLRLAARSGLVRKAADWTMERLIADRHRANYYDHDNRRVSFLQLDQIAGPIIGPGRHDTTLALQADWLHTDIESIAELKARRGFRHVILCYDIIPILHPEFFDEVNSQAFGRYYRRAISVADRLIFTSRKVQADFLDFARTIDEPVPESRVISLGADAPDSTPDVAVGLPAGLEADKYVLYVSTIEPRKNHQMLVRAWKRLAEAGVVREAGCRLVLLGRLGWKMDGFAAGVKSDPALADSVIFLDNVGDATLSQLYRSAAFCVFPSFYEGFGLPPAEALAHGKALIATDAGAVPEVVGDSAVSLSPHDEDAWFAAMRDWLVNPAKRDSFAAAAARRYRPVSWDKAGEAFIKAIG